jgi:hypothetical protein
MASGHWFPTPTRRNLSMPIPRLTLGRTAIGLSFLALLALGGLHLDSDPSPLKRLGDVGDEGWWQHNARCKPMHVIRLPAGDAPPVRP